MTPAETKALRQHVENEFNVLLRAQKSIMPFAKKLIELVILCRRRIDHESNFKMLDSMVCRRIIYICNKFNYRWINSIIDTYVELGTETQKLQALVLSQYMCNLVALQVENKSAKQHYEYVSEFGEHIKLMRPEACNKFPFLFQRIDELMVDEPFRSLWHDRLRPDLDQNKTSWRHIAGYSNSGVYYRVRHKADLPGFVNVHMCKNVLLWRENDENFISEISKCKSSPNVMNVSSCDEVPYDLIWDFVYFNDPIETMINWKSLIFNKRIILAGSNQEEDESHYRKVVDRLITSGIKAFYGPMEESEPHGWFVCSHRPESSILVWE